MFFLDSCLCIFAVFISSTKGKTVDFTLKFPLAYLGGSLAVYSFVLVVWWRP